MKAHSELWPEQLQQARALLVREGENALRWPHAETGKMCRCGDCFCCAALQVWREHKRAGDKILRHNVPQSVTI